MSTRAEAALPTAGESSPPIGAAPKSAAALIKRARGNRRRPVERTSGLNRATHVGAALIVVALVWWAITYATATSGAAVPFGNSWQCILFRTPACYTILHTAGTAFPYTHLLLWLGIIVLITGLWRSLPLVRRPPDWFRTWRIIIYRLFALVIIALLWWEASRAIGPRFPTPYKTLQAAIDLLGEDRHRLRTAFFQSLYVYLTGFGLGAILGVPLGLLLGGFRVLGRTLEVYINGLMATPRVSFIPLIIFFLGIGYEAKIFIIFLGALLPIIVNTYAGVMASDGELVEMARSTGASRRQIFIRILLPGALPYIVVGLRVGATIGLINTVVAELYTASSGLGGLLSTFRSTFRMDNYLVVVLCLAFVGVVVTSLLRIVETRMERWRYDGS